MDTSGTQTATNRQQSGTARFLELAYQVLAALNAPQGPGNKQRAKELCGRLIDELKQEAAN